MPYIGSFGETNENPPASRSSLQCWPDLCSNSVRDRLEHAREGIQHAHHLGDGRARKTAVLIAVLAAALAVADLAEKSARNEFLTRHVVLSDDWSFYQAKNAGATIRSSGPNW